MDQPIVGIRFVEAGPIAYCSPGDLDLASHDYVVVRTDQGEQLGWVVVAPDQVISQTIEGPVRVVDRLASAEDVESYRQQKRRAEEDHGRAQEIATRVDPRMRVASLTYSLSGEHADLTYTAKENNHEARLERELSRALGAEFRVWQVGDRDRAKSLGGIGQCGRALCCSTWMTEFPAISIKMAKDQGLAPNPSKISGVCGRLLCCLSFEVEAYRSIMGTLPKVGKRVTTPAGRAKVLSVNALTEVVRLRFDEGGAVVEMPAAELRAQYGTAVRPEELEADIEGPVHEQDRRRRDAFVAVIEPVERPSREEAQRPERGASTDAGPDDGERTARRRRRRRSGSGATDGGGPTGETATGGVRIERRRSTRTAPVDSTATAAAQSDALRPNGGDVASGPDSASTDDAGGERRARRRGRRGGRRRRGGGGDDGGNGASE